MSSKIPYMPFYPTDYLADPLVRAFTLEEHGAYLLLLIHLWNAGGWLPDDDRLLMGILGVTARKWKPLRSVLIDDEIWEIPTEDTLEFDERLMNAVVEQLHPILNPILRVRHPVTGKIMITQKRLFMEYQKSASLLEKRREGGRKGGSTPKAVLKQNSSTPQAEVKESLSTPQADLKHTSSNIDQSRRIVERSREPGAETPSESPGFSVSPSLRSGATPPHAEGEAVDNSVDNTEKPQDDAVSPDSPAESERPEKAEEPTNHAIIRELTAEYRAVVDPQKHKASDWQYMGAIYTACGVEAVKVGIEELAEKLTRGATVEKPLPYVGTVARRIARAPVSARNGHGSRDRPGTAEPEPGSNAWYDALPDGPDSWEILRQDWQEHGGEP